MTNLQAKFEALGAEADSEAAGSRAQAAIRTVRRRNTTRRYVAGLIAGTAIAAAGLALIAPGSETPAETEMTAGQAEKSAPEADFIMAPVKPGEPCAGATRLSVSSLAGTALTPVWVPSSGPVGRGNIAGAFLCGSNATLTFSGYTVSYERGWTGADPTERFEAFAAEMGGTVESADDGPILVQPSSNDTARGQALLIRNGVLVRVLGTPTSTAEELLSTGKSLASAPVLTAG